MPAADGMKLLERALDGNLSEEEAVKGLIDLGASESLLRKLGISSEIHAGTGRNDGAVSWMKGGGFVNRTLYPAVLAFFLATGQLFSYTVKKGDTLWGIARANRISVEELANANPQVGGDSIRPGMELVVPEKPAPAAKPAASDGGDGQYVVVDKDTGYGIAKKLGIKFKDLDAANPGVDWTKLQIGQKLSLPDGKPAEAAPAAKAAPQVDPDVPTDPRADYLARVIYAETSSIATDQEVRMICQVIMNRVGRNGFPGNDDPHSIVSAPRQFSCTSGTDGNVNWRDYRRDLNKITERDYGYAVAMLAGDTSWMVGGNDIVFYCNKELGLGKSAVGKKPYLADGKEFRIGHPEGFGKWVVPVYMTKHFIFYKRIEDPGKAQAKHRRKVKMKQNPRKDPKPKSN